MNAKYTHATRKQTIEMSKRLEEVLEHHDGSVCEYKSGHNDQTLADEFKVSKASVQGLRTEIYGKLFTRGPAATPKIEQRVENHAALIASLVVENERLKMMLTKLTDHHNLLIDNLVINRVVTVKHLKIAQKETQTELGVQ